MISSKLIAPFLGFLLAFSPAFNPKTPSTSKATWLTDYEQALAKSKTSGKKVLISFAGSDWCKPCIKLTKEVFESETFQNFADENLVMLLADFPRLKKNRLSKEQVKHNEQLAKKYNNEGVFPLVVLVDSQGMTLDKIGYKDGNPQRFLNRIKSVLND
ncbi:thioredoxin family protein [Fulvivirgaceae bacterium BMA10]|uniref:Thioredoxin family protein n=1 Tax=Splendidivirga corallicola TaxID=3051826 RepID=A0ABT8KYG1_9BACT|nr:thioredoxin family protein [Fulvivirgaceae bacterium BMA10]